MTYLLSSLPYLDPYNICYKNIITINKMPEGPLKKYIKRIKPPKLSIFSDKSACCTSSQCVYAVYSFDNTNELLCIDNIVELFNFLLLNNYKINSEITKIMNDSEIKQTNSIISFIDYTP